MKKLRKLLSDNLKKTREERRLSQSELADICGLEPSAISHFETGRRAPTNENLLKLANALEADLDVLFGRTDHHETWPATPFARRVAKCMQKMSHSDQQSFSDFAVMMSEKAAKMAGCTA